MAFLCLFWKLWIKIRPQIKTSLIFDLSCLLFCEVFFGKWFMWICNFWVSFIPTEKLCLISLASLGLRCWDWINWFAFFQNISFEWHAYRNFLCWTCFHLAICSNGNLLMFIRKHCFVLKKIFYWLTLSLFLAPLAEGQRAIVMALCPSCVCPLVCSSNRSSVRACVHP